MRGSTAFFKKPPKLDPADIQKIDRALKDLWRRLGPRKGPDIKPRPRGPVEDPTQSDPKPETEKQPDPREDECVGDCDDDDKCPTKTFCFNKGKFAGTTKDALYDAQLNVQEKTMRTMSPGEFLYNRGRYETLGRSALERDPDVQSVKARVIGSWEERNRGRDWRAEGLQALHRLDMGAGGSPMGYYDMGDASINQSIGGSWPSKINKLKQHAKNLQENGCPLMKVRFDSSPSCVADYIPSTGYPE